MTQHRPDGATAPALPAGRYGNPASPARRRAVRAAVAVLGVGGLALAVWLGVGAARTPVQWNDIGFTLADGEVEVVFEVVRRDPSDPVVCRVQALNQQYAQVGVREVDVAPARTTVVRVTTVVQTSEPAVTGIVESCGVLLTD